MQPTVGTSSATPKPFVIPATPSKNARSIPRSGVRKFTLTSAEAATSDSTVYAGAAPAVARVAAATREPLATINAYSNTPSTPKKPATAFASRTQRTPESLQYSPSRRALNTSSSSSMSDDTTRSLSFADDSDGDENLPVKSSPTISKKHQGSPLKKHKSDKASSAQHKTTDISKTSSGAAAGGPSTPTKPTGAAVAATSARAVPATPLRGGSAPRKATAAAAAAAAAAATPSHATSNVQAGSFLRSPTADTLIAPPEPQTSELNGQIVMDLNGTRYAIGPAMSGTEHAVHFFTEQRLITVMTVGGPKVFQAKNAVMKTHTYAIPLTKAGVNRLMLCDMQAYDYYLQRGLNVPEILVRPNLYDGKAMHKDTFIDPRNPLSGGFWICERIKVGFNIDGVRTAANLAALTGETAQMMDWSIGQFQHYLRHWAQHKEALFDDFKPENIGFGAKGFCHADPHLPIDLDDLNDPSYVMNIFFEGLRRFFDGNEVIYNEMLQKILSDPRLAALFSDQTAFKTFQTTTVYYLSGRIADWKKEFNGLFPAAVKPKAISYNNNDLFESPVKK